MPSPIKRKPKQIVASIITVASCAFVGGAALGAPNDSSDNNIAVHSGLITLPPPGRGCTWQKTWNDTGSPIILRKKHHAPKSAIVAKVPPGASFTYEWCNAYGWVRAVYGGQMGWVRNSIDWWHH